VTVGTPTPAVTEACTGPDQEGHQEVRYCDAATVRESGGSAGVTAVGVTAERGTEGSVFNEKEEDKLFDKRWSLEPGSEVCLNFGLIYERHEKRYWSLYT
jgi:hypothetical protein